MTDADDQAKLIDDLVKAILAYSNPQPQRRRTEQEMIEAGAMDIMKRFEQRAREIDEDSAPTGIDAIQLKYYSGQVNSATNEQSMEPLRRFVRGILKL